MLPAITVDLRTNRAIVAGEAIKLRAQPVELLHALVAQAPEFLSKEGCMLALWGRRKRPKLAEQLVRTVAWELRDHLEPHGVTIVTRRGVGYAVHPFDVDERGEIGSRRRISPMREWTPDRLKWLEDFILVQGGLSKDAAARFGTTEKNINITVRRYLPHIHRKRGRRKAA